MTKERAIQILEKRSCCRECVVINCTCAECDEAFDMAIKALEQEPKIDLDELKRKILMEVDGGTDDKWLRYADVCDRISDSIDEYKAESEG